MPPIVSTPSWRAAPRGQTGSYSAFRSAGGAGGGRGQHVSVHGPGRVGDTTHCGFPILNVATSEPAGRADSQQPEPGGKTGPAPP